MRIRHSVQKNPLVWTRISEIMTCEESNIFLTNLACMAHIIQQDDSKLNKDYIESLSFGKILTMGHFCKCKLFWGLFATHSFTFKPLISSFYYFVKLLCIFFFKFSLTLSLLQIDWMNNVRIFYDVCKTIWYSLRKCYSVYCWCPFFQSPHYVPSLADLQFG